MKKLYDRMNLLQKHIFGFLVLLLGFFVGGIISFCSAQDFPTISSSCSSSSPSGVTIYTGGFTDTSLTYHKIFNLSGYSTVCFRGNIVGGSTTMTLTFTTSQDDTVNYSYSYPSSSYGSWLCFKRRSNYPDNTYFTVRTNYTSYFEYFILEDLFCGGGSSCPEPESSTIDVLYNNENSTTSIACDGDNVIQIDGLSIITATNKFTPYFNIDYVDEDNQSLIESYDKDMLILSGGKFKKTYTGDNEWILSVQENKNTIFTGYIPFFDVTGSTDTLNNENVFNNFSDNALKVLLSNIPSYIQYITIFFILLFLFGFIRRFKRKR